MTKNRRVVLCLKAALLFFWTLPAVAFDIGKVASSPEWLALGHYRPAIVGVKSTIDSEGFFLDPDGKTNPEAELNATLKLFQDEAFHDKKCLFPARYLFLKKQGAPLAPFPVCAAYDSFKKDTNSSGITLLYTDAYMNNPSSLFGHTLLRLDIPEGRTQLVAHGMNFGAFVNPDENGILFAVLGLTGGYFGGFTVKPYYQIIQTYNNIENRDIWEYSLALTPEEVTFFTAHLWEIGNAQVRYFFFTENCSYLLMEVFDAVRPSLKLADDFPRQVIPLDTVKAVSSREGLVSSVAYRPSRRRRILSRYAALSPAGKKAVVAVYQNPAETDLSSFSDREQSEILETVFEYVQHQYWEDNLSVEAYRQKSFSVLRKRNKLALAPELKIEKENPLTAHDSAFVSLALGWQNGQPYQEFRWRPAYHELTDPAAGLLAGAEINFLDTRVRHYSNKHKTVLQNLTLVGIRSLAPFNRLFQPLSWEIQTDVSRLSDTRSKKEGYVASVSGGSGVSFEIYPNVSAFFMMSSKASYGGFLPHDIGISLGPKTGLFASFNKVSFLAEASQNFSFDDWMTETNWHIKAQYHVTRNVGLFASFKGEKHRKMPVLNEISTGIGFYF